MILCKDDYTILSPLAGKDWSDRSIRKGLKYEFPPAMIDVFNLDFEGFKDLIKGTDKENIVKTLAIDLGLGGVYAEEACFGIVDKEEKVSDEKTIQKLFDSFKELISREKSPVIYGAKKGFPFKLKSFEDEFNEYDSFSAVIDNLIVEKKEKFKNKFTDIISKQQENLEKIEVQAEENTEKGNKIYNNYTEVKNLLADIDSLRKEKGWDAVKEKYKDCKNIKKIDSSKGKMVIDI
jgi:predicted ribosome quality control (RQC) complex YloA/Tae2 family protein